MPAKVESGLTDRRVEFAREGVDASGDPVTPDNPTFERYADVVHSYEWSASAGHEAQRGLSNVDPANHFTGPEEHDLTVTYDLQRWLVTAAGDPQDAAADGILRDPSGYLPSTHTFLDREEKAAIAPDSTINGATSHDTRIYTVGRGGYVDEVTVTGDPGSQQPIEVELSYMFEKMRSYQIDQPAAATGLVVSSDSAADMTQTVTIEAEGGAPSDTLALNGTTLVVTSNTTYADIDAIELSGPTEGTVTVAINTGTATAPAAGDALAEIQGTNAYDNPGAYELGVPAIGTGSHAAAVGTGYETFLGDTFTRGGGPLAMDINSFEVSVANNSERNPREEQVAQRVSVGTRETEVSATVLGERETHSSIMQALRNTGGDIVWTMTGGTITIVDAKLTEPGARAPEAENPVMTVDNTFAGEGITLA